MGNAVLKNSLEGVTNSSKILQKAGLYVQAFESSGIDITTGYDEWLSIGFALLAWASQAGICTIGLANSTGL